MEFKVIKQFKDKFSKAIYPVNSVYQTEDVERAKFLQENGYLYAEKQESNSTDEKNLLDESVEKIKKSVTAELGKEKLEILLKLEKGSKDRKGVIEHIEELLQEVE
ncbi:hypothetical protein P4654_02045 [Niallia taxi]|uniref:hypothetical protein n=1 Tax=Niallia taxi TaxID=2499688 RepID=UPI002E24327C|nr:hypothetical protein [Niallia taxi]MED4118081.1 hypothetical protein [Niallia taxi]